MVKAKADNYWEPHARILESMPRFQSAISGVRKRLNIPASGIPFENRADWFENFYRNPDEDTAGRYGGAYEYQLLPPNKELLDELDSLRLEFNLDPRWLHPLFNYIFSAEKSLNPPSSQSAWPSPRMNDVRLPKEQQRVTSLSIRIEKDTTIHDIEAIWPEIKKYQAYMDSEIPSRRDAIQAETVERYKKLMELRQEKKNTYEIIAKDYPKLGFDTGEDVRGFIRRIEKRFKKRSTLRDLPNLYWHN
jgi:hypothetical protein